MHSMSISLPAGELEVEYTDAFIEQVRQRYGLSADGDVDPSLIRAFLEQELRSALSDSAVQVAGDLSR